MGRFRELVAAFSIFAVVLTFSATASREALFARSNPTADIYPPPESASADIQSALKLAAQDRKNILLIFGGNWCYDCHVLDEAFHTPEIAPTVVRNFVVVHVNVGEYDKNLDLAKKYEVPLERGVPAAAVLESDGKLLFTQKNQEFEKARSLAPEDVLAFLNKWKLNAAR